MSLFENYDNDLENSSCASDSTTLVEDMEQDLVREYEEVASEKTKSELSLVTIWRFVRWTIFPVLVPSFLRGHGKGKTKLYPTSYLDGLRGVAAFIVYIDHFAVNWFDPLRRGYGSTEDDYYIIQLPFIRLLYSGRASVAVFFVISGFVLSYKPLKQIHAKQHASLLDTLASSVFRRGLRLYIPVAVGTFLSMLMAHWEWYQELPETSTDALPPVVESFGDQFQHWRDHMVGISWPFQEVYPNTPYGPPYNGHLWTIPIEFYGSIVVYIMCLSLCRCYTWIRLVLMAFTSLCCLHYERWDIFLFLSGTTLAEISLLKPNLNSLNKTLFPNKSQGSWTMDSLSRWLSATNWMICFVALYLLSYAGGSYPDYEPGPGIWHEYLMYWTPYRYMELWYGFERFWVTLGGFMLVFSISNSELLQRPFITRLSQYLGDISYALYIVHGPILFTVGAWFMNTYAGDSGLWYAGAFAVAAFLNTFLCFWAADLFWRGVDAKSVVFAKWFAEKCWVKE